MKYLVTAVVFCVLFVSMGYASSVTKTVGTSDPNYNYPTIAAAFAAINAGGLPDSVTLVLMDSTYNEHELLLAPPTSSTKAVSIAPPGVTNVTVKITAMLGTGVGITVDSVRNFTIGHVTLNLDISTLWNTAVESEHMKNLQSDCWSVFSTNIIAPTAKQGIKIHADSGGTFTMQNSEILSKNWGVFADRWSPIIENVNIAICNNIFHNNDTSIFLGNINAHLIKITGNTFDSVGSAIVINSIKVDSVIIYNNKMTGDANSVPSKFCYASCYNVAEGGTDENVWRIAENTIMINGNDSSIGISINGIRGGIVSIDSNKIDMGGAGTAIRHRVFYNKLEDADASGITENSISHVATGIDLILNNDTTGLGGINPDSLTFGSFDISNNRMTNVINGCHLSHINKGYTQSNQYTLDLIIRGNTITGYNDGTTISQYGIFIDSLAVDTLEIDANTMSHFIRATRILYFIGDYVAVNHNTLTGDGSPGSTGILIDSVDATTIEITENTINDHEFGIVERGNHGMRDNVDDGIGSVDRIIGNTITGTGTDSSIGIQISGQPMSLDDFRLYHGSLPDVASANTITHVATGIDVLLNNDTTGLGGFNPDSLTFGSFEISDNVINTVGGGNPFGLFIDHTNNGHGQGNINSVKIKRNVMTGDGFPGSNGILLDSLSVHYIAVDSNIINGYSASISMRSLHIAPSVLTANTVYIVGNHLTGGFKINSFFDVFADLSVEQSHWNIARNTFDGGGIPSGNIFEFNFTPGDNIAGSFASALFDSNTIIGFTSMIDSFVNSNVTLMAFDNNCDCPVGGCKVSTARRQSVDEASPLAWKSKKTGAIESSVPPLTFTMLRNHFSTNIDGFVLNVHDIDLQIQGNTFTGAASNGLSLTLDKHQQDTTNTLFEGNVFSNNGGKGLEVILTGDSGFVDAVITGNNFSDNSGDGLLLTTKGNGGGYSQNTYNLGHAQGGGNNIQPVAPPSAGRGILPLAMYSPNSFMNNGGVGLQLDSNINVPDGIHYQNFSNNGGYNFVNRTKNSIDVTGCWWGTSDSATIAAKIFDGNDSAGLGVSNFSPFLTESILQAYVVMNSGWNLVSVPVVVNNFATTDLFPNANSKAFSYAGSYHAQDTLKNGPGYWIKTNSAQSQLIVGLTISSDTIDVIGGWNMIGAISSPVKVTHITSIPGGIVTSNFFGYGSSYTVADSIRPGKGYWVKVNSPGKLVLASSAANVPAGTRIRIVPSDEMPPPAPGVEQKASVIPKEIALLQNYPNPFNPTTLIGVDLPAVSEVTLKIYNMLGQEVAALLSDRRMEAGSHKIEFNASNFPSGMYFYRLTAEPLNHDNNNKGFNDVRKMLLIK